MIKNKELFRIENHRLYREKNLIDLQIPVFFVCKDDDEKRYLVLLTDFNEDEYLICPISESDLLKMLKAQIPMREAYVRASKIYMVRASKSIDDDIVKDLKYAEVEDDMLPEDGAFFDIDNQDLQDYISFLTSFSREVTYLEIVETVSKILIENIDITSLARKVAEDLVGLAEVFNECKNATSCNTEIIEKFSYSSSYEKENYYNIDESISTQVA